MEHWTDEPTNFQIMDQMTNRARLKSRTGITARNVEAIDHFQFRGWDSY